MKLSTRGEYGLRAMIYLAQVDAERSEQERGLRHAQEISDAQGIPTHYLKQILSQLRSCGLIRSVRGPAGGHGLARSAGEIVVGEVIECLEGTMTCVDGILDMPCSISVGPNYCVIKEFLLDVKAQVELLLNSTTIADLMTRQKELSLRRILVQPRFLREPPKSSRAHEFAEAQES